MPEITIGKSEKYREVIEGEYDFDEEPESEEEFLEKVNYHEASNAYLETINHAPTAEDMAPPESGAGGSGTNGRESPPLSWDDFSPSSDPDLVSKIATYFDGMEPDDPTGEIRAKLRLVDCEVYANAQIAAQAELRD